MRLSFIMFAATALVLSIFFKPDAAAAAQSPSKLSCPAAWSNDSSAKRTRVDFTTRFIHNAPLDFPADPAPYGAVIGDELFCAYSNGHGFLITIPGKPRRCYDVTEQPTPTSYQMTDAYCTYTKTGDAAKDAIQIRETALPNRETAIHGVRLGMSHDQVAASITPKVAPLRIDDSEEVYVLPDTQQLLVGYGGLPERVVFEELKPKLGQVRGLFIEARERFGVPEEIGSLLNKPMVWSGLDGVRLAVLTTPNFRGTRFSDEYEFLLDEHWFVKTLDKDLDLLPKD